MECHQDLSQDAERTRSLRRTVVLVALLNLAYFFVEGAVALWIGSVSLFADSIDFFEDFAVNMLIALALGWSLVARAWAGRVAAAIICLPAVGALWQAVAKFSNPEAPEALSLLFTAGGAIVINAICALILSKWRSAGGSLTTAAFLAARNDIAANAAIILMAGVTVWTQSGWPDIILGLFILLLNATAAKEVWEAARSESLAARALAGESTCGCSG